MESGNHSEIVGHILTAPFQAPNHLFLKHDQKAWSEEISKWLVTSQVLYIGTKKMSDFIMYNAYGTSCLPQ